MRSYRNPIEQFSDAIMFRYLSLSPSAKAAWDARAAVWQAAVQERDGYREQLANVERQLRNINPLPASHPACAQEPALLAQQAQLQAQIAAVDIPSPPWGAG